MLTAKNDVGDLYPKYALKWQTYNGVKGFIIIFFYCKNIVILLSNLLFIT